MHIEPNVFTAILVTALTKQETVQDVEQVAQIAHTMSQSVIPVIKVIIILEMATVEDVVLAYQTVSLVEAIELVIHAHLHTISTIMGNAKAVALAVALVILQGDA